MRHFALSLLACIFLSQTALAESLIEPDYDGDSPKITTPWIEYYTAQNYQVDQNYITDMRPHHAGALPMSEDYLAHPDRQSDRLQALARGIIRNQTFEITLLDMVERKINAIDFNHNQSGWHPVAEQGIAMRKRFIRSPMPPIQGIFATDEQASAEDVRFAKAMIVHHEGALMMAEGYLANPDMNNGYLARLNLDILRDQAQEIDLMWNLVGTYPGDHCDIQITPDMIEGMDNMMHHMDFSKVNCTAAKKKHHMHHGQHSQHGQDDQQNHSMHHGH